MNKTVKHVAIVLLVAITVMFTNLGATRLWDRDEPRNAGCAEEMMRRGDWVVPIFNDQLRDAKPVLLYWLIISAYEVFGVDEFAARFWSAALAVGSALGTYVIGRRLFNPAVGLYGAVILSSSLMFGVAGRAATPDSPLIFCTTMALMIFVLGTFRAPSDDGNTEPATMLRYPKHWFPQSWLVVALMYAVMGIGILAKGPVGLVLPTAVIGMFLLITRLPNQSGEQVRSDQTRVTWLLGRLLTVIRPFEPLHFFKTCWYMRPVTAFLSAAVVAAPWFILVGLRTEGDFLEGFFITEHFGRATQSYEGHRGSILFYPLVILICFFPWSVFAAPTVAGVIARIRRQGPCRSGYIFLACWVGVYVGIFTIAQTKLPSYITPCYPALALLTGGFIYHWTRGTQVSPDWLNVLAIVTFGLVGLTLLVGLPLAAAKYLPGEEWLAVIGLIPLLGALAALACLRFQRRQPAALAVGVSAVVFVVATFAGSLVRVDRHQENDRLFETITENSQDPSIASFGCLESTWVFYTKRPIIEISQVKRAEGAREQMSDRPERAKSWHPLPKTDVQTFFATRDEPYLITTKTHLSTLRKVLPQDVEVLAEAKYFLKPETLVVLGRSRQLDRVADSRSEQDLR